MASRLFAELARTARAVGGKPSFPGVSDVYQNDFWPQSEFALDFPKAAALVPTVYACINRIAQDIAATPPTFWEGDEENRKKVKRKPGNIVDLYARANPVETGYELERDRQWSLDQNGNAYLWIEKFNGDPAAFELWNLPGHLVRPVSGPRRTIKRYEFGLLGSSVELDPENVIPFRYPNPNFNPLEPAPIGISPLEAARQAYETRFDMAAWQRAFYKHGGAVAHLFNVKERASINDKEVKAMQSKSDELHRGLRNAFKPVYMAGVEILKTGLTQQEMRYIEAAMQTDADVCRVYGMPPVIMGIKEGGGLSDAGASTDQLLYWVNCLIGRLKLRDAVLTEWLCPLFGKAIHCDTDLSRVLPLMEAMLKQAEGVMKLTGRPIFTVNMALERLGLPESESPTADALALPFSVVIEGEEPAPVPAPAAPPAKDPVKPTEEPTQAKRAAASDTQRREALRRRADADLSRYERRVASLFRDFFTAQEAAALVRLGDQARRSGMDTQAVRAALNPEDLLDPQDEEDMARLQRIYEALIAERGEAAAAEIGRELVLDVASGRIAAFVRAHADRALSLTSETTARQLRESLAQGIEAQESFGQLVARVRTVFDDRRANAITIARTETVGAYNFAAMEAWRGAEVQTKEWLTVGDDLVRVEHSAAESQGAIPIDQAFDLMGEKGMYPGDPSLSVGLTANCRCVLQPGIGITLRRADDMDALFTAKPSTNGHGKSRVAHLFAGAAK